jgi:FkbM family methyltransferase
LQPKAGQKATVDHFMSIKNTIKQILKALPFDFTQNQKYDRLTRHVIARVCRPDSNCLDVGCHKGEILDLFIRHAPQGTHYGFEPIPDLYAALKTRYTAPNLHIRDIALSNQAGTASFNYVVSNPSYSGLQKRKYDRAEEQDTLITVQTATLDSVLPAGFRVDMIKIDVEGGELLVLQGARETLHRWKPVLIFEHGLGASDVYGATPEAVFDLLTDVGLQVSLLDRFMKGRPPLGRSAFSEQFYSRKNYYFIAYP